MPGWEADRVAYPVLRIRRSAVLRADSAPDDIAARRSRFARLSKLYRDRFAETNQLTAKVKDSISDLQFTEAYRVPFQFSRFVREHSAPAPSSNRLPA